MALTNKHLVDYLLSRNIQLSSTQEAIKVLFEWLRNTGSASNIDHDALCKKLQNYMSHLNDRWRKSARNYNRLINRFSTWSQNEFHLPIVEDSEAETTNTVNPPSSSTVGRPSKSIADCSDRSKRRKIKSKYGETDAQELLLAAQSRLFSDGKRNQAQVIGLASTLEGAQKLLASVKKAEQYDLIQSFTPEEALVMMLGCGLSKRTYQSQRKTINSKLGFDFIPSYDKVIAEKRKCCPTDIEVQIEG